MNLLKLLFTPKYRGLFYLEKCPAYNKVDLFPGYMEFRFIATDNIIAKIHSSDKKYANKTIYVKSIKGHCMGDTVQGICANGEKIESDSFSLVKASLIGTLVFLFKKRNQKLIKES